MREGFSGMTMFRSRFGAVCSVRGHVEAGWDEEFQEKEE